VFGNNYFISFLLCEKRASYYSGKIKKMIDGWHRINYLYKNFLLNK